jgi:hypothetical protein
VVRREVPPTFFATIVRWLANFHRWRAANRVPIGMCYVEFKPLGGAVRRGADDIDRVGQAFRHGDARFWLLANCFWSSAVDFELEAKIVDLMRQQLRNIVLASGQRTFSYPGYRSKSMPLDRDEMDAYYDDHVPRVRVQNKTNVLIRQACVPTRQFCCR